MNELTGMVFHSAEREVERLERQLDEARQEADDLRRQVEHANRWRNSAILEANEARAEAAALRRQLAEIRSALGAPDNMPNNAEGTGSTEGDTMIEDDDDNEVLGRERENEVLGALDTLLRTMMRNKPGDRSNLDRVYAVALTDTQRVYAWFSLYAYGGLPEYID